jgi:hypothetical protein
MIEQIILDAMPPRDDGCNSNRSAVRSALSPLDLLRPLRSTTPFDDVTFTPAARSFSPPSTESTARAKPRPNNRGVTLLGQRTNEPITGALGILGLQKKS